MTQKQLDIMLQFKNLGYHLVEDSIYTGAGKEVRNPLTSYGSVCGTLANGGKIYAQYYRLKYFLTTGDEDFLLRGLDIHHVNGDPTDNRIENLQVISREDHNSLHKSHESHHNSKLTYELVRRIREDSSSKRFSYSQLSNKYGVTKSQIGKIIRQEQWKPKNHKEK